MLYAAIQNASNIVHRRQISEEGAKIRELRVVRVVEPRRHGHGVVGVEDVGRRRIVEDDGVPYRAPELRQVLITVLEMQRYLYRTKPTLT